MDPSLLDPEPELAEGYSWGRYADDDDDEPPLIPFRLEDEVRIKTEPRDDDEDLFMPEASPAPESNAPEQHQPEPEQAAPHPRPLDANGEEFPTICFERPYHAHPYKHRLICGHTIVTKDIVECGANCHPSRSAESKPKTKPFPCPHPTCAIKREAFSKPRGRQPVRGQSVRDRQCELSHIYGISAVEDAARTTEKNQQASFVGTVPPKLKALYRKNSVSPPRRSRVGVTTRSQKPKVEKSAEDVAKALEEELDAKDAERVLKQALKGNGGKGKERAKKTSRAYLDGISKTAGTAARPAPERKVKPAQKRKPKARDISGKFNDADDGHICDGCEKGIYQVRWTDTSCKEFDLCEACYQNPPDGEAKEHKAACTFGRVLVQNYEFELVMPRAQIDTDHDEQALQCVCETTDLRYMLDCQGCKKSFHPGCVGQGIHPVEQYDLPLPARKKLFKSDWKHVEDNEVEFVKCLECKHRESEALEQLHQDLQRRRENKTNITTRRQTRIKEEEQSKVQESDAMDVDKEAASSVAAQSRSLGDTAKAEVDTDLPAEVLVSEEPSTEHMNGEQGVPEGGAPEMEIDEYQKGALTVAVR